MALEPSREDELKAEVGELVKVDAPRLVEVGVLELEEVDVVELDACCDKIVAGPRKKRRLAELQQLFEPVSPQHQIPEPDGEQGKIRPPPPGLAKRENYG